MSLGLVLELNIEQREYIGALSEEAGVKLDMSNQGEMPFPLKRGLSIAPGFETSIGFRKVSEPSEAPAEHTNVITREKRGDGGGGGCGGVEWAGGRISALVSADIIWLSNINKSKRFDGNIGQTIGLCDRESRVE